MAPSEDDAPKEELDDIIEDCDSMLYIVARVRENREAGGCAGVV